MSALEHLEGSSARVLLIGDIHLRDKPPRNCTDAYLEDIFEILAVTVQLEDKLNLDAVIWAGDVFDHKVPSRTSHKLVLRTIELIKRYKNLLIVTGNHDVSNDRLESVRDQQPLGVLLESGATELNGWDPTGLPIFGLPWQQDWFSEGRLEELLSDYRIGGEARRKRDGWTSELVVTHAPISPSTVPFDTLDKDELSAAMGNEGSLYYGHIHDYHGIYEHNGVTYCNPGAISRGSLTEENTSRTIKAALWTPEKGFYEINLPHRPASEIFKLEAAQNAKNDKLDLNTFLEDISSTRIEISSTASVISHINSTSAPEPVRARAVELLELVDG